MIDHVNQNTLPGIEDPIRARLRDINQQNGTNFWPPSARLQPQRDAALADSSEADGNSPTDDSGLADRVSNVQLAVSPPDLGKLRKGAKEFLDAMCPEEGESCQDFHKRLYNKCVEMVPDGPLCKILADARVEPCLTGMESGPCKAG